eukprot:1847471-Pleurochrysis_carterae.AAC.3
MADQEQQPQEDQTLPAEDETAEAADTTIQQEVAAPQSEAAPAPQEQEQPAPADDGITAAQSAAESSPEPTATPAAADPTTLAPAGASDNALVELKFTVVPEGFSHSRQFQSNTTIDSVKAQVENDLQIPAVNMKLLFRDNELGDGSMTLGQCGMALDAANDLELQIIYLDDSVAPEAYVMPDVISVEVHFGSDIPPKLVSVPIVRAMPSKKAFLGGFRSKKTRTEYHHACTQTDRQPRPSETDVSDKFERETQTAIVIERSQQSVREAGTQMTTPHLTIDDKRDRVMHPLPYFDSDQLFALRLEKTIDLQRQVLP